MSGNEQMQVDFHNKAAGIFFSVYRSFEKSVSNISRRNEEFKFQQLKKQYAEALERELQIAAKEVLTKFRNENQMKEMDQIFHRLIKDYLHRFVQRINDQ